MHLHHAACACLLSRAACLLSVVVTAAWLPAQSPGFWEPRPPMAIKRQEVAAAVLDGLAYVGGGLDINRAAIKSVERYDPKSGKWSRVADMPTTLHHFGMATAAGKVYAIGGYVNSFVGTDKCWAYDPKKDAWTAVASLPRRRGALVAVAINDKIYAIGGVVPTQGVVADLTVYDPKTNKWTTLASMGTQREHLAATVAGGKIYVAGGRIGARNNKVLEVYDPKTNKWTRLRDMPTARGGNGAGTLNGRPVVVGGEIPGVFKETEEYDPASDSWRRLEDMAVPVHGIYPVTIGDEMIVAGGGIRAGFGATNAVQVLKMFPDGVTRFGTGSRSCRGNITMYVTHRPKAGEKRLQIVSQNGPPSSVGFLAVGKAADLNGSLTLGFRTHLNLSMPIALLGVKSDAAGKSVMPAPVPPNYKGLSAVAQFVWANTKACGGAGTVSSSNALAIVVQ